MIFNISNSGSAGNLVHLLISYNPLLAGATITATNGSEVHTAIANESGLTIISGSKLGEWTIELDGNSVIVETTFYGNYEVGAGKPEGSTVTPVNDIRIWLKCAEINKSYTTMAQVLGDTATLSALISDNNASDYMARSTAWANSVAADQTAMTYIGNNDYCANKLLADSTWLTAICNSTYFERVLNVKVPTMTSNTTPYGEVIADSVLSTEYDKYLAFNNFGYSEERGGWHSGDTALPHWIGYKNTNPINVKVFEVVNHLQGISGLAYWCPTKIQLQGSNDGAVWENISEIIDRSTNRGIKEKTSYNVTQNDKFYLYHRVHITEMKNAEETTKKICTFSKVQFYGSEEA